MVCAPYCANIQQWISADLNPSAHRYRTMAHCYSMVQSLSEAAILLPSLLSAMWLNDGMVRLASYTSSSTHMWCCVSVPLLVFTAQFQNCLYFVIYLHMYLWYLFLILVCINQWLFQILKQICLGLFVNTRFDFKCILSLTWLLDVWWNFPTIMEFMLLLHFYVENISESDLSLQFTWLPETFSQGDKVNDLWDSSLNWI
jgi:hypothetical protein